LYARFARPYKPMPARNELTFLLFILGLKVGWPMHTPFSQEVWVLAMKDGNRACTANFDDCFHFS
ncbi:MAG: hypothetical protein ACN6OP_20690, partial [Pseudomonadales bacterium]